MLRQHIITPTEPTNLVVTAPNANQANLTWTAATTRPGGSALLDYVIEYKKTSDTQWLVFDDGVSTVINKTVT